MAKGGLRRLSEREEILKRLYVKKGKLWYINSELARLTETKDILWVKILELEEKLKRTESDFIS